MELDWSAQSPHIRMLYHPWQPGDGYDEAEIEAAEARLGLRLPATLRNFYLAYGRRRAMTHANHLLSAPDFLVVKANTLIFCQENQICAFWGIPCEALEENWRKATIGPLSHGVDVPDSVIDNTWPPVYVRDGQAFRWYPGYNGLGICSLAAREAEALDEISQRFQIKWHTRCQTGRVNNLVEIERPERIITWLTDPPSSFRMWL